ncbi:MAG: modulated transcriptional regulator, LuxR family [Nocardioides sp.]|nr:modulated transcriptional regulator, LuxR family [Nocardioides sp.]
MTQSTSAVAAKRRAELARTGAAVHGEARRLLAAGPAAADPDDVAEAGATPAADLRTLDGQLAVLQGLLRERLRDVDVALDRTEVAEHSQVLHELHQVRFGIHDLLGNERLRRLDQLDSGLQELRRITDQNALLEVACELGTRAGGFERVMLSRVEDGVWRPWRSHSTVMAGAERRFAEWIREVPSIQLSHMVLESELVRRREGVMVVDASRDPRVYAPLAEASELRSYVAAPIISGERVIGLLHADNRGSEVTPLDRDILWSFAIGFAQVYERAVLLARLRDQRAEVLRVMRTVETVLEALATSEIELATHHEPTAVAVTRPLRPLVAERPAMLEKLLTQRELEVLALMATGATNDRIAQRLVIATATVKSHVKQVLRKLRVENRAEAISTYLRLTIGAHDE